MQSEGKAEQHLQNSVVTDIAKRHHDRKGVYLYFSIDTGDHLKVIIIFGSCAALSGEAQARRVVTIHLQICYNRDLLDSYLLASNATAKAGLWSSGSRERRFAMASVPLKNSIESVSLGFPIDFACLQAHTEPIF